MSARARYPSISAKSNDDGVTAPAGVVERDRPYPDPARDDLMRRRPQPGALERIRSIVEMFDKSGGKGKPRYGSPTVCWAEDEKSARRIAHRIWPMPPAGSR
jgi:hypothetical protein